jgi:hypothetical protein
MNSDQGNQTNNQKPATGEETRNRQAGGPKATTMKTDEQDPESGNKPATGALAANPDIKHEDIASADTPPSQKKEPSAIPGAEEEGRIGNPQAGAGFAGGTKGAGTSSEGRKGDPANYGSNQAGSGMATGPVGGDDNG